MITSIITSHQNTRENDYLNFHNNRISVTPEINLYIGDPIFCWEKNIIITPFLRFIARRNDATGYMTQRPKVMINRGSIRLAFAVRSVLLFLFLFRNTCAAPGIASAYSCTQTAYELRGSVHACTHVRILAAEYNSGNTMELGQSCFDARLRSFHLLRRASFGHVSLWPVSRLVSR